MTLHAIAFVAFPMFISSYEAFTSIMTLISETNTGWHTREVFILSVPECTQFLLHSCEHPARLAS